MGRIRRFFFGGRKRSSSAPKVMDPPSAELPKRQSAVRRSMRRIRKSFKKEKGYVPPASKPHIYAKDEKAVRNSDCSFSVKYLGAIEVTESRGMSVCEEAAKKLRANPQHKVRAVLQVSGDALRVVEEGGQGLLVDQTIEKVSFCAPDRHDDRGFSYISRDGTTRRWLCHCFLSMKEPGERLSHAVGCAFAACLERKQQRDKLCGVQMEFDVNKTSFTRQGSFKQTTMTEQLQEEAQIENSESTEDKPAPPQPVVNPYAIPRRHATDDVLQRQGSFRGLTVINNNTPFKRNLSLRLNELPSTLQRQNQILETVPDLSPTSPTGNSHGTGVLTEHPEHHGTSPPQAQIHAQVHTGSTQPDKAPVVKHPVVFTQNVTPPPGYGEPPPVPQPVQPFGPAKKPVQPSIGAQQPLAAAAEPNRQQPAATTNPWGDPQSYNPWGDATPPAATKSEAEKWLEDTSRTVTQKKTPQVNGGGAAAVSVNHNNANIATPPRQQPPQNVGTGINGSWVADISQSLQSTGSGQKTNGHVDPEFEAKLSQSPQKGSDGVNPFGNAVKTFEINL